MARKRYGPRKYWVKHVLNPRLVKSWFVNTCTQLNGTNQKGVLCQVSFVDSMYETTYLRRLGSRKKKATVT